MSDGSQQATGDDGARRSTATTEPEVGALPPGWEDALRGGRDGAPSDARGRSDGAARHGDHERRRLRAALDCATDGIFLVDPRGPCFVDANASACASVGYDRAALLARTPREVMPGLVEGDLAERLTPVLRGEADNTAGASVHRRRDGSTFPVDVHVRAWREDGNTILIVTTLDGTATWRELSARDDDAVSDAGRLQEMLASRLADRLASIGTLAAGLGHDMHNVLLPVRSRLEAAESAEISPECREHLVAVRRAVAYLQQLAEGLHLLALDPDDEGAPGGGTDLAGWWEHVGPLLGRALPEHVALDVGFDPALPRVAVTPHQLTQAILNLLVNAGEAIVESGHPHGRVRIDAGRDDPDGWITLRVRDDGCGMTEEVRDQVLDPFYTTKKRGLGTGMGLTLVHGVVRSAGGRVEIESEPGGGTTITMRLREAPEHPPPEAEGPRAAAVSVEDRRLASMVQSILGAMGFDQANIDDGDPATLALWITDPTDAALAIARRFEADRRPYVIVIGSMPPGWEERADSVLDPWDFQGLRAAIGDALASGEDGTT